MSAEIDFPSLSASLWHAAYMEFDMLTVREHFGSLDRGLATGRT